MAQSLWLLGGDGRNRKAGQILRANGCAVHTHGVEGATDEPLPELLEIAVLPFPACNGDRLRGPSALPIAEILPRLHRGSLIFGGQLGPWRGAMIDRGATVYDLLGTEPLTTQNAAITAEAALSLAMLRRQETLRGASCLVIGWGRIGRVLSRTLAALGAEVTVAARNPADRAMAEAEGRDTDVTSQYLHGLSAYDIVFNTVPAAVLSSRQLEILKPSCLLMELASTPGGFSPEAAKGLGLDLCLAPGLPGRYAPDTAGALYARAILSILNKEEPL